MRPASDIRSRAAPHRSDAVPTLPMRRAEDDQAAGEGWAWWQRQEGSHEGEARGQEGRRQGLVNLFKHFAVVQRRRWRLFGRR